MKQGGEFGKDAIRLNVMRIKGKKREEKKDRWSGFSPRKKKKPYQNKQWNASSWRKAQRTLQEEGNKNSCAASVTISAYVSLTLLLIDLLSSSRRKRLIVFLLSFRP